MLKRYVAGIPAAVIITGALGVGMINMISVEFKAQETVEGLDFEINPEVIEIPPPKHKIEMEPLKQVEVPPAVPRPDYIPSGVPTAAPEAVDWKIPVMKTPKVERVFTLIVDQNPTPIVRIPGTMPARATKSGHCKMQFAVSAEGTPYNVEAVSCSQSLFERNSVKAAQKFKYRPRIQDGQAVAITGVKTTIRYNLVDEQGRLIPE